MKVPDVSYTRSGDVAIAYQVVGEGPEDLVLLPFLANIWSLWTLPSFAEFGRKLALERRLIVVNPRGVGLSDRPRGFTIESRMDDVRAVMDAVGSERAALLGIAEAAATCAVFAASYPERVSRLLLFAPYARGVRGEEQRKAALERVRSERERWGERGELEEMARRLNPQWSDDQEYIEWFVWHHRLTSSPATITEFRRMQLELDITDVLSAIRVPTLVMAKETMREESIEVAELIPDAELVELPAIDGFLGGVSPRRIPDTVLATLLFTDLVGSTERAVELGDREWGELLAAQKSSVRRELERYRGVEVDTAGDGFFARFDGPARAIACAQAIIARTRELGLDVRAGIHTGECEIVDGKPAGISVVVGARVSTHAAAGQVLVTGTVKDLVAGSGLAFQHRGEQELKGVPGTWSIYAVSDG
jgi:class 3 adenylate cyclase